MTRNSLYEFRVTQEAEISILDDTLADVQDLALICGLTDAEECCELEDALVCTSPDRLGAGVQEPDHLVNPLGPPVVEPTTNPDCDQNDCGQNDHNSFMSFFSSAFQNGKRITKNFHTNVKSKIFKNSFSSGNFGSLRNSTIFTNSSFEARAYPPLITTYFYNFTTGLGDCNICP